MVKTLLTEYGADSETEGVVKFDGHVIEGATALWCAAGDWEMMVLVLLRVLVMVKNDDNDNTLVCRRSWVLQHCDGPRLPWRGCQPCHQDQLDSSQGGLLRGFY